MLGVGGGRLELENKETGSRADGSGRAGVSRSRKLKVVSGFLGMPPGSVRDFCDGGSPSFVWDCHQGAPWRRLLAGSRRQEAVQLRWGGFQLTAGALLPRSIHR